MTGGSGESRAAEPAGERSTGIASPHERSGAGDTGTDGRASRTREQPTRHPREFVSYVAVHPDEEPNDPDGFSHENRMALEEAAISFILGTIPNLRRTPTANPGFDLMELDDKGNVGRWIEVKAMAASLESRPATMTHTQFDHARKHGDAYWLFIVEYAGDEEARRLLRIQNPAGRARTYTFDRGWAEVAESPDHVAVPE